ncbi:uncharacterized protein LOC126609641 [Malus sylvestris]|uniref:uncharacterized protein LOC126609641 n=1 Tax=Malus sylvestris TaxID=3752 RepID=UPI0021AC2144|nr:uncharacterized protein LOC126609641 [Malus sylvestris]
MATLQKFKLLATQCAVAGSPTRSPSASPVIHLRRRKTLRMFLTRQDRRRLPRQTNSSESPPIDGDNRNGDSPQKSKEVARVRRKLKDLFVSSPPFEDRISDRRSGGIGNEGEGRGLLSATGSGDGAGEIPTLRGAGLSLRPITASFRNRLLKRAWRPVLVTIPE